MASRLCQTLHCNGKQWRPDSALFAQEYCEDCPDQYKTIRRDAAYKDNSLLPAQIALRTGDLIYDGLKNGFRVRFSLCMLAASESCFCLPVWLSQTNAFVCICFKHSAKGTKAALCRVEGAVAPCQVGRLRLGLQK